jgi:protocatechuate 3,4-dioxygenase beta subunit
MKNFLGIIFIIGIVVFVGFSLTYSGERENQREATSTGSEDTKKETAEISPAECTGIKTPELTEGPYYKENSPEKTDIKTAESTGTQLILTGYVLDLNCRPIANAWLDFWQADGEGNYDNNTYNLRGHQYTDQSGKYKLETVIPGEYPGRTPHIHVKLRAAKESPVLTTQLFLPDAVRNDEDSIFDESLIIDLTEEENGLTGEFNFIINHNQ